MSMVRTPAPLAPFAVAGIALVALILGGCGGEDDPSVSNGRAPGAAGPVSADDSGTSPPANRDRSPDKARESGGETGAKKAGGAGASEGGSGSGGGDQEGNQGDGRGSPVAGAMDEEVPSEAEFIASADSICARAGAEITKSLAAGARGSLGAPGEGDVAGRLVAEVLAPGLEAEFEELSALSGPAGATASLDQVVAAMKAVLVEAQADPAKFASKPEAFATSEQIAKKAGFKQCGGVR